MKQEQLPINPFPPISPNHPAYVHSLICEAVIRSIPFVILTSESIPRTINLMSWCCLETQGDFVNPDELSMARHDPGAGHDCLTLTTPNGIEIELTTGETAELIEKLELMLGKKQPAIVIPNLLKTH